MQIFNKSKTYGNVHAFVHKALPYEPSTTIATIPPNGIVPASGSSGTVPAGDSYYVAISGTFGATEGKIIAATGGVSDNSTVTLTENNRIVVS
jgi:hypothetical protein